MPKNTIYKRKINDKIIKYLNTEDIVVLHGARQVGKTSILKWIENYLKEKKRKVFYIDLEFGRYVDILNAGPSEFLKLLEEEGFETGKDKKTFVLIDEIQYLEDPSSFLKLMADHHKNIKLIVSGSSSFEIKSKFRDSLVGRTVNFEVFGLCFEEFLLFKKYHYEKGKIFTEKKISELKNYFKEYVLYGGYPKIVLTGAVERKEKYLEQILDTYVKKDIRDLAEIKDIEKFNKLLEALASQSGNLLNVAELANTSRLSMQSVDKYLFLMENTYIIKLLRPFSGNIRAELFKKPKIFFYDSGLMQMLWLKRLQSEIIGNVFETSILSELIKIFGGKSVYFWRTKNKQEIDFILKMKKEIMPIESKLNFEKFKGSSLDYFKSKYKIKKYKIIGLWGKKKNKDSFYPWEI